MEQYNVLIKPSAVKEIKAIPTKKDRTAIAQKIKNLSSDPRPHGCQKLTGNNRYRIRQGHYRILYSIEDKELIASLIVSIGKNNFKSFPGNDWNP